MPLVAHGLQGRLCCLAKVLEQPSRLPLPYPAFVHVRQRVTCCAAGCVHCRHQSASKYYASLLHLRGSIEVAQQ